MDQDRKYRQRGYQDSDRRTEQPRAPRPQGPRPPLDITGPRLPRLVQSVTASRCFNCATTLPAEQQEGNCPKCNAALHCCKQCTHFEPSTRFQCLKPVPVRIAVKDAANECTLFQPRVTVARDAQPAPNGNGQSMNRPVNPAANRPNAPVAPPVAMPRSSQDARTAFDNLFKK